MIRWMAARPAAAHAFGWAVLLLGGLAAGRLPLATRTTVEFPQLYVSMTWPGASAELVESYLTAPLEAAAQGVRGVKRTTSESSDGKAELTVELQPGTDTRLARLGILERIEVLRPEFPAGAAQPAVSNAVPDNLQERPLLQYTLSGPLTAGALSELANREVVPVLASIRGVAGVAVFGAVQRGVSVTYDPDLADQLGIPPADIALSLNGAAYRQGVGMERRGATERPVLLDGSIATRARLEELPIRTAAGRVHLLGELATVRDDEDAGGTFYRIDGVPAVSLTIARLPGADAIATAREVRATMDRLIPALPPGVRVAVASDEARGLSRELTELAWRSVAAFALVCIVILATFRSARAAMVIMWATAVAIAGTALTLYALRIPANLLTLAGLGMGVGILVQGAAIVTERLRGAEAAAERAERTGRISAAVIGSILTTVVVLLPFTWLQGNARAAFVPFAAAFAIALGWSLFVSLALVPAVMPAIPEQGGWRRLRTAYERTLLRLLRWRYPVLAVTVAGLGALAWGFTTRVPRGSYSNWYGQRTTLGVRVSFPRGTDPASLDIAMRDFERIVAGRSGVEQVVTHGMPDGAFMQVVVAAESQFTPLPYILQDELTQRAVLLGGAQVSVYGQGPGFSAGYGGGGMSFRIKVQGYSWDGVEGLALDLRSRLERIPRVRDVDINAGSWWRRERGFDIVLVPDRGLLASLGMTVREFADQVAREVRGPVGGIRLRLEDGEVTATLKAKGARERDLTQLRDVRLPTNTGAPARVRDVAGVEERETLSQISRDDQQYVRIVSYDFRGPPKLATRTHEAFMKTVSPPPGYVIADQQFTWDRDDSTRGLWMAFGLGVVLVILSVALVFDSWWAAGLVLLSLPLALAGVAAIFWATGTAFSREAAVGVILVVGLAVNQVILLLDGLLARRRSGAFTPLAVLTCARERAGMIMLVTLTTLASLVPLAAGTATDTLFGAIALASAGGTVAATLAALFVMPLMVGLRRPWRRRAPLAASAIAVASVLVLGGCAGERSPDSAGGMPAVCDGCIDTVAVSAESLELTHVSMLDTDSRGRVYIPDFQNNTIRVLAPDGSHLASIGRKGSGPGEFEALISVRVLSGDTIVGLDVATRRLTWFAPDSFSLVRSAQVLDGSKVLAWDGGLLMPSGQRFNFADPAAAEIKPMTVRGLSMDGSVVDSAVAILPGDDAVVVRISNMMMVTGGPFVRRTLVAASGGALFSIVSDSTSLVVHHLRESRQDTIRLDMDRIPLPRSTADSAIEDVTKSMPPNARKDVAAELAKHVPSHRPAVRGMVSGDPGDVVVGLITEPGVASEWRVIRSDGVVKARYRLPSRLSVERVRGDRAWAIVLDENEVPWVYFLVLGKGRR